MKGPRKPGRFLLPLLAALAGRSASAAPPPRGADPLLDDLGDIESVAAHARWDARRAAYVAPLTGGRIAELTLDRDLQEAMTALLANFDVPASALVVLEPSTGRILAWAEGGREARAGGLAARAHYPAASVFKLVTGTALLEAGIAPDDETCFHGGQHRVDPRLLRDDPRRDNRCETLADAMGKSLNVVFAKLGSRKLAPETLREAATRFLFNVPMSVVPPLASVAPGDISRAVVPDDELGLGRTAAGFGEVYLSPLHGAVLAAAVGTGGIAREPRLVDAVVRGPETSRLPRAPERRMMAEPTAQVLAAMMERTVSEGTARRFFLERRRPVLGSVRAAGKTGSLADRNPFRDYSWFVGFAPVERPVVAVAAVVVNGLFWKVKAPYLAREAMRVRLRDERTGARRASR